jgi:hypothetical protein
VTGDAVFTHLQEETETYVERVPYEVTRQVEEPFTEWVEKEINVPVTR